jgi:hypothetical protein
MYEGRLMPPVDARADKDKVTVHPVVEADTAVARIAARLTGEFYFRTTALISEASGGDLMMGLIHRAIITGNTSHFDNDLSRPHQYTGLNDPIPDEFRRPISVLAVADSLGFPYETTRRCVNKLVKSGICVRRKGGVVAVGGVITEGPDFERALRANMANIRRFLAALKLVGAV